MPFIQLTFNEVKVFEQEIIIAALSEIEFDSFQQNEMQLLAFIDAAVFNESTTKKQLQLYGQNEAANNFLLNTLEAINWNKKWEENFPPVIIADEILIKAPFHKIEKKYTYEIELAPKMAFGTGHHETTYMMLEQMLSINFKDATVLDYGCGTGILAIFAAMKNAKVIDAIDIDDWAYKNTLENLTATGIKNVIVRQGDINLINDNKYGIIMANINKNVILKNINKLFEMLLPKGHLLISGILINDIKEMERVTVDLFNSRPVVHQKGKWALLKLKKL